MRRFTVGACVLSAAVLLPPKGSASERVFAVAGQSVHVPSIASPQDVEVPQLFALVVASEHSLTAALTDAGFEPEADAMCDSADTSWELGETTPLVVSDRQVPWAARYDRVGVFQLTSQVMGMPVWALFGTESPAKAWLGPGACTQLRDDMQAILTAGIAREKDAAPLAGTTHSVPWIELRHSAGELEELLLPPSFAVSIADDWNMEEAHAAACLESVFLPPPLPLPGAVVDTLIWRDNLVGKEVALTFDACSTFTHGDYNPAVIDALIANQIPATLFIGGHWAEMHPKEVQWLAAQPWFELGNHTYSHPHMTQLTPAQQRQELLWTQQIIFGLTGRLPKYWRPPYGEVDDTLIRTAASIGLYTVEFDLPAGDADYGVSDARLIDWIVTKATSGTIVVMHMNRPGNKTAEVLPSIASALRAKGYVFTKVGDMLSGGHSL